MKNFINSIFSFLGLFLITFITAIAAVFITNDVTLSLGITATIFILGFIGLIKESYLQTK